MSNKQANDGEAGRETSGAGRRAWAGRAMLALVPLAVLVATGHQMLQLRAEERWLEFSEDFRRAPLPETRARHRRGSRRGLRARLRRDPAAPGLALLVHWTVRRVGSGADRKTGGRDRVAVVRGAGGGHRPRGCRCRPRDGRRKCSPKSMRWFGREVAVAPTVVERGRGWARAGGRSWRTPGVISWCPSVRRLSGPRFPACGPRSV